MRRPSRTVVLSILLVLAACAPPAAETPTPRSGDLPSIAQKTAGFQAIDGFLPLYWDEAEGQLWLEVPETDVELLYVHSLASGVGSNDIGLDRNQLGRTRVVQFERAGRKLFLVEPNHGYRAVSDNPAERRAVEDAFARSILWGFTIAAETDGRLLVDATEFVIRDVHGVADRLRETGQGSYELDESRSAVHMENTRAFPRNSEVEVVLTFTGDPSGGHIRSVTPTAEAVTVRQRHSFVASPPPGYEPRELDPRAGFFGVTWMDYAAPLGEPMARRWIARHRLEKQDPAAAVSDPVEPIVYYLDPGVPEPVRSALLEGARWWNGAFEAAGYRDAFRVEILPDTADPLDVRYNIINWVHRSTRGWSYGSSVTDPRTGEIIKGHVLLGSLRVRQDYLLAEGLLSPYEEGGDVSPAMREMALARIRQLSAHEVGHTIGLAHNYVASTEDRASVMDYPHPLVRLDEDGSIDLSAAYDTGIGEWDEVAVTYGRLPRHNRRGGGARADHRPGPGARTGLPQRSGRPPGGKRSSAGASLGQRPGRGRGAETDDGGSTGRAGAVRRIGDPDGHAAGYAGGGAGPAVPPPPLPDRGSRTGARREVLQLRDPGRRTGPAPTGPRRRAERRAGRTARDPDAGIADAAPAAHRRDPPAAVRLPAPPGALRAVHRDHVRPDRARRRGRPDDRAHDPGPGARRPAGRAGGAGPGAAIFCSCISRNSDLYSSTAWSGIYPSTCYIIPHIISSCVCCAIKKPIRII